MKAEEQDRKKKRTKDKKKVKNLLWLASLCLIARLLLFTFANNLGGLFVEILWIPIAIVIIAIPFYGFEYLLDRISSYRKTEQSNLDNKNK